MPALQRKITGPQIEWVAHHRLFGWLKEDIKAGKILPCLRKGEIHFYEGGARLLKFSRGKVYTHARYACAGLDSVCGNADVVLPDGLEADKFELIREAARTHRDKQRNSELGEVHKLFQPFAVTRKEHKCEELALIDVEIRFGKDEADPTLSANMIDLAFLLPNRELLFVEAKCIGNPDISSTTTASVERQVGFYERHILRSDVLEAINRSLDAQSRLIGRPLGNADGFFPRVPVLILNPSRDPNPISKNNHWLRRAIAESPSWTQSTAGVGIIDWTLDPIDAIRQFANKFGRKTA